MAKGIYERMGKNGDATYYIRYQYSGTEIKERVGRKSRGFYPRDGKGSFEIAARRDHAGTIQSGEDAKAHSLLQACRAQP